MTTSLDIANLKALYSSGALTPEALVRDVYTRVRAKGVHPDWISLVDEETAVAKAKCASNGPLRGIPFAVKDNIDVAGMPTTCACPAFAYTPTRSASVVEKLEAAGAILIGKTNLDQFATGLNGTRSPYGIPTSVFASDYISGGSSSGSAVAVAAGLVSFALGTDTAGSGRVPAAFNNIVGLKPTKGIVSTRGVVPACRTLDVVSIFALTVSDAATVMQTVAGYDVEDPFSLAQQPKVSSPDFPQKLHVGIPNVPLSFFGDAEYQRLYHQAIDKIATLGAEIVPIDFAPFAEAADMLYAGPWVAERLAATRELADRDPFEINEIVRGIILGSADKTAVDAFEAFYKLAALSRRAETEWAKMNAMLLPTAGTTYKIADMLADPVQLNSNLGAYTNFVNLLNLAAISVPAGFRPDGIPFGVTLIGPASSDVRLGMIGDALHRTLVNAKLGATQTSLVSTPIVQPPASTSPTISVAVVGAHLSGQPLNGQLRERGARLVETAKTAEGYSFYALAGTSPPKPGLVFDGSGSGRIEVEIWEMDIANFGSFVALIPSPLGIGTLRLVDGRTVKGFVCETYASAGALDITAFGGWRNWLASRADEIQKDEG